MNKTPYNLRDTSTLHFLPMQSPGYWMFPEEAADFQTIVKFGALERISRGTAQSFRLGSRTFIVQNFGGGSFAVNPYR